MQNRSPILPGSTLGVLGGGQLGRMFAIAARRMGYRVHVLAPDDDTPTGQVADIETRAAYDDLDAVADFARRVDVVTFEFENVDADAAAVAATHAPVRPSGTALQITQHRLREKGFLREAGLPVTEFAAVRSTADLRAAIADVGLPAVLKTAAWGYDGKGQSVVRTPEEADAAWIGLSTDEAVLERLVEFDRELSVVVARGLDGSVQTFGPFANDHVDGVLDVTLAPFERDALFAPVQSQAVDLARRAVESLGQAVDQDAQPGQGEGYVGVLCVEMFMLPNGELLINELAPRPHNSGHLTIDAFTACQFEQQVRAVCGLPLAQPPHPVQHTPAAMANLLGDLWFPEGADGPQVEPDWAAALAEPGVKLHLYGKRDPRLGRKMGHLTALAPTPAEARDAAIRARRMASGPRA